MVVATSDTVTVPATTLKNFRANKASSCDPVIGTKKYALAAQRHVAVHRIGNAFGLSGLSHFDPQPLAKKFKKLQEQSGDTTQIQSTIQENNKALGYAYTLADNTIIEPLFTNPMEKQLNASQGRMYNRIFSSGEGFKPENSKGFINYQTEVLKNKIWRHYATPTLENLKSNAASFSQLSMDGTVLPVVNVIKAFLDPLR